jgi:hypothetical protein
MKYLLLGILLVPAVLFAEEASVSIEHKIVAIEKDRFHGWPANNGVWQWGNEILVGFTQGDYFFRKGHNIGGRQDSLFARSKDGGESWTMFDPENFLDDENEQFKGGGKTELKEAMNFEDPGFALRIFATGYHGNDDPEGGFYYSYDRGQTWNGPHFLTGLNEHPEIKGKKLSPRTDYLIEDGKTCRIFISAEDPEVELARLACIQTTDGGLTFEFVAWVTPDTEEYRAIMCQTVKVSEDHYVLAHRKIYKDDRYDTIETYHSTDDCKTWEFLSTVKIMKNSSNPPALVKLKDGRLCCAYGDRNVAEIRARYSNDNGASWGPEFIIRDDFVPNPADEDTQTGKNSDIGYVRLVQRPDGKLVAMYYWGTEENVQQHIAASIFMPCR